MTMIINTNYVDKFLKRATETQAFLNTCRLKLNQSSSAVTCTTPIGTLSEATFTGYTQSALLAFGTPTVAACVATMSAGNIDFTQTAITTTNNIYGYYIYDPAGADWVIYEANASAPVAMNLAGLIYRVALAIQCRAIP